MPQKLKLLPCPVCYTEGTYLEYGTSRGETTYRLYCECGLTIGWEQSKQSAIAVWNSLPRALTWTMDTPTVPGWYYTQVMEPEKPVRVVYVKVDDTDSVSYGSMIACEIEEDENGWIIAEHSKNRQWAGPIPAPKEPTA